MDLTPGTGKVAARERRRSPNRLGSYLLLILGSGAAAALIALVIAFIPTVLSFAFPPGTGIPIDARQAFPSVSPTHRVINVYDPPTAGHPTAGPTEPPQRNTAPPSQPPQESPEPNDT